MKPAPALDEVTYQAFLHAQARARWTGVDLAEHLNRRGLLWTPDRERKVRAEAIAFILEEMRTWQPHEFLRKVKKDLAAATPTDMYMAICQWVEEHLAVARSKP